MYEVVWLRHLEAYDGRLVLVGVGGKCCSVMFALLCVGVYSWSL